RPRRCRARSEPQRPPRLTQPAPATRSAAPGHPPGHSSEFVRIARGVHGIHRGMTLDPDIVWRAWTARVARFVGRFVMGVTSPGLYGRRGGQARLAARRTVGFGATPAAAESAGVRACLRCRPDRAPGSPTAAGTTATVARALRLIDDG